MSHVVQIVAALFIAYWLFCTIVYGTGRDDTDAPGRRSRLVLYTDAKTGLQYVGVPFGGLTPRLDVDGKQMRATP